MARSRGVVVLAAALTIVVSACSSGGGAAPTTTAAAAPTSGPASTTTVAATTSVAPPGTGTSVRPPVGGPGRSGVGLATANDCPALLDRLRTLARAHVTAWGLDTYGPYGGGGIAYAADSSTSASSATTAAAVGGNTFRQAAGVPSGAGTGSSSTNVQEEGIDEGDQVENDGRYVYTVLDGRLRVIDTTTAAVSTVDLPTLGQHQLVLDGARLVVVSGGWGSYPMGFRGIYVPYQSYALTTVTVLDVSDPMKATVLEQRQVEGIPIAVRAAGGTVRLVLSSVFGGRLALVQPAQSSPAAEKKARASNESAVAESTIEDWLPQVGKVGTDGSIADPKPALDCEQLNLPSRDSGLGLTWVASIDLTQSATIEGSAGVVAQGGTTYASASSLYVTTTEWQPPVFDEATRSITAAPVPAKTAIHQFEVSSGTSARYVASGQVTGTLFSSYALSEHEGTLRVATTTNPITSDGTGASSSSSSGVHVLQRQGDTLTEVGAVTDLGRNEQIYAVRFLGAYGYVVTFQRTDPLFVLDLRDPTHPALAGQLDLPGYSSYLHPVGDGLLLGVGQSAGDDGRVQGLQVSLFDVRDPTAPVRLDNEVVGGYSQIEWDPHAFLYWSPNGTAYVARSPWWDPFSPNLGGVTAVRVADGGLTVAGTVPGPGLKAGENPDDPDVQNRMGLADVQRALVVGGKLVLVGVGGVRVADAGSLAVIRDATWSPYGA